MGLTPLLPYETKRRLKEIDPHFRAIWNKKRCVWDIWYFTQWKAPYIVTPVQDEYQRYIPIDGRTFSKLRRVLWYNQWLKQHLIDIDYYDELADQAKDKEEEQRYKDIAKENRRVVQMMAREFGYTSGKAKIPYSPGFGVANASNN